MARDRASIRIDMWADEDWRALTMGAQHLYMLLLSHPTLSYAGVADWREGRLAAMTAGRTAHEVKRDAAELTRNRFILTDSDTEEVLVRSFVKHDGLIRQPKLAVSMANAYAAVASWRLREVIAFEVQKLHHRHPELSAWAAKQVQTILVAKATGIDSFTPAVTPGFTPAVTPTGGQALAEPTTTATTTATSSNEDVYVHPEGERVSKSSQIESEFSEWWAFYPRKQGKADAFKAFKAIRKKVALKTLIEGAQAYALLNIGEDKSFLKLPGGWLRGERWEDEQIVNATRTTTTNQPAECLAHPGYPLPCDKCARDADEGRAF